MRAVQGLPPVFTVADLERRGVTREQAEYRVQRGVWHRLQRGVYCTAAAWARADSEGRHVLAASAVVLAARATTPIALSHTSAAVMHDLPVAPARLRVVTATTSRGSRRAPRSDRHLHVADLTGDVVRRRGVPVTSVARTVADCLRQLPVLEAVAVADAALHVGQATRNDVREVLARQAGWPFSAAARLVLPLVDARRESPLESRSAVVMARHGIPAPVPQCRILDLSGVVVARVDFGWPELGVVGEADGKTKYGVDAARVVAAEKDRHALLEALGLVVVRWDDRHLLGPEPLLVTRLNAAFARGDGARFLGRVA